MVAALMLISLLVGAALAPRYGAESRPDFTGHPDWRSRVS